MPGRCPMQLPDFLCEAEYGEIRLTGHRIGLYHVISHYKEGYSPEMLHEEFPSLPLDLINKVIRFELDNKTEVDAYVAKEAAEIERQVAAAPPAFDWEELRRRYEAMRQAEKK